MCNIFPFSGMGLLLKVGSSLRRLAASEKSIIRNLLKLLYKNMVDFIIDVEAYNLL